MTRARLRSARQFLLGCFLTGLAGMAAVGFAYAAHANGHEVVRGN